RLGLSNELHRDKSFAWGMKYSDMTVLSSCTLRLEKTEPEDAHSRHPETPKAPEYGAFDWRYGGGGEIRTHGRVSPSTVFKTVAFNRSATPPQRAGAIVPERNTLSNSVVRPQQKLCYDPTHPFSG